ncbi:tetratricopeptide repeat-containing sulfotransferase family protein [Magnetococcus sp. PR-3]|uniref:tetratricopeptide repeat-containing sulfotransferase family protein n=1 Tax=Magnetococcus sp. PR-3 TaxID=3120355 RepID=UPI002FCE11DB
MSSSPPSQLQRLLADAEEHLLRGRLPTAWNQLDRARRNHPNDPGILALMTQIQIERGDGLQAEKLALMATTAHPNDGRGHLALGDAQALLGKSDDAENSWKTAARLEGSDPEPHVRIAQLAEKEKRFAEAESAADRALALKSDHILATFIRARCDAIRNQPDQGAKRLLKLSIGNMLPAERVGYYFELAHHQRDARRFQQAFESYSEANRLQGLMGKEGTPPPSAEQLMPELVKWTAQLTPQWVATHTPALPPEGAEPVFIVGYPRSGLTLLTQMLAAHPRLVVMSGYRLPEEIRALLGPQGYPQGLAQLDAPRIRAMRQMYYKKVQSVVGELPPAATLLDVHPLHLLDLPLIQRIFPTARIIHVVRHPMDSVLQCYIRQDQSHDPATLSAGSIKGAVALYVAMMNFFNTSHRVKPLPTMFLRYESIIENMPLALQGMLKFLNIVWDDAIRRYRGVPMRRLYTQHELAEQIDPLHGRQVDLWPSFHQNLRPFIPMLDPYAQFLGYPKLSTIPPRR